MHKVPMQERMTPEEIQRAALYHAADLLERAIPKEYPLLHHLHGEDATAICNEILRLATGMRKQSDRVEPHTGPLGVA